MTRRLRDTLWVLLALAVLLAGCGSQSVAPTVGTASLPAAEALPARLKAHVVTLSEDIGNRSVGAYAHLNEAADYIGSELGACGYEVSRQSFSVRGKVVSNILADQPGAAPSRNVVLVGAHYDTYWNPGADDNASGVALMLELARRLKGQTVGRPVRFAAFVNEEGPYGGTGKMGSLVYANAARAAGATMRGALILDMVGYYPGKIRYFLVGVNRHSQALADRTERLFAQGTDLPTRAIPRSDPSIRDSDNWAFWHVGYPALFLSAPGYYRSTTYHTSRDRWWTLDYEEMAESVRGLESVVLGLSAN
jgi:hypothetical protein